MTDQHVMLDLETFGTAPDAVPNVSRWGRSYSPAYGDVVIDITCLLTFLIGLAVGIVWQEIHFSDVSRALHDANARMDTLERRLVRGEPE